MLLAGSIVPNTFIPVTIDATIVAIPGLVNILHTRIKIIEVMWYTYRSNYSSCQRIWVKI